MSAAAIQRFAERARKIAEIVAGLMFAGIFVAFLAGIVMRYVFARPLLWSDEVAMLLLLWSTFIADAFVVRAEEQVAFDVLWDRASPAGRRIIGIVGSALFGLLFLAALPTIVDYVLFLWRERTDMLELRLDIVFSCFIVYVVMVVVRLAARGALLIGPNWRAHVAPSDTTSAANVIG